MKGLEIVREKVQNHYRTIKNDEDLEWNRAIDLCVNIINAHLSHENTPEITRTSRDNGGWIPVEKRLPEVDADIEETIEDGDCTEYIVTIKGAQESTVLKYSPDGAWFDENGYVYDVVAWRPLPSPYCPWKGEADKSIITKIIERLNHLCALNSGCGAIFGNTKEKKCYYKGREEAFEQAIEEIQEIYDKGDL